MKRCSVALGARSLQILLTTSDTVAGRVLRLDTRASSDISDGHFQACIAASGNCRVAQRFQRRNDAGRPQHGRTDLRMPSASAPYSPIRWPSDLMQGDGAARSSAAERRFRSFPTARRPGGQLGNTLAAKPADFAFPLNPESRRKAKVGLAARKIPGQNAVERNTELQLHAFQIPLISLKPSS